MLSGNCVLLLMRFLIFLCAIGSCLRSYAQQQVVCEGQAQGTYYIVKYLTDSDTTSRRKAFDSIFSVIDQSMSLYQPGSLINRFNSGTTVITDEHLHAVITKALSVSKWTGGAFDITVKPLVDLWGFGVVRPAHPVVPSADSIRAALRHVGYRYLQLQGQQLRKRQPGVAIDCNGIAQGYTVDVIGRYLETQGIRNYLVDVGGELRARGRNQKGLPWSVGIERPSGRGEEVEPAAGILRLDDKAVATSGNYRRFFDQGGTRFAHTIDPHTGAALHSNIVSVTVIAPDCITADGFDNALILMGVEKGIRFVQQHPQFGLEVYYIFKDAEGHITERYSPGFATYLETAE